MQQKVQSVHFALRISPVKGLHQLKTSEMDFSISLVVSCPYIWIGKDQRSSSALAGEARYKVILCKCFEIKISYDLLAKRKKKVATLKNLESKKKTQTFLKVIFLLSILCQNYFIFLIDDQSILPCLRMHPQPNY